MVPVFDTTSTPASPPAGAGRRGSAAAAAAPAAPRRRPARSTATCSAARQPRGVAEAGVVDEDRAAEPEARPRPAGHRRGRGGEPVRRRPPRLAGPQPHHLGGQVGGVAQHVPQHRLQRRALAQRQHRARRRRHHLRLRQRQARLRRQPAEDLARVGSGRAHRQPDAARAAEAAARQASRPRAPPSKRCRGRPPSTSSARTPLTGTSNRSPGALSASAGPASPGPQARNTRLKFRFIPEIVGL